MVHVRKDGVLLFYIAKGDGKVPGFPANAKRCERVGFFFS